MSELIEKMREIATELNVQGDNESASTSQGYYGESDGIRRAISMVEPELNRLTADNARLRESIQSVLGYANLPQRYRNELEAAIESLHDAT